MPTEQAEKVTEEAPGTVMKHSHLGNRKDSTGACFVLFHSVLFIYATIDKIQHRN